MNLLKRGVFPKFLKNIRFLSYEQGQEFQPGIREYFYYINHEGMLFLDDAKIKNFTSCFKEKKFLKFFFNRIKLNDTNRFRDDFPFISPCGRERNYIRCDDLPIVFNTVLKENDKNVITYAHVTDLKIYFQPQKIYMNPENGRVYHPAWEKVGNIGLVQSKLAIELSKYFEFADGEANPPTQLVWDGVRYEIDHSWIKKTIVGSKIFNKL